MTSIPQDAYIMIIGAMKAGTTSIFELLSQHPQICASKVKEPEFFSQNQGHGIEADYYEDLFEFDSTKHKYALEASTGYTKFPVETDIPKRIMEYGLMPKFIYILRDPFERMESQFNFMLDFPQWAKPMMDSQNLQTSNYYLQIKQYLKYFDQSQFLLLDFADLQQNPSKIKSQLSKFLSIPEAAFSLNIPVENKSKSVLEKKLSGKGVFKIFPKLLKQFARSVLRKTTSKDMVQLTFAQRRIAYQALEQDMVKLHSKFDFDVAQWGFLAKSASG